MSASAFLTVGVMHLRGGEWIEMYSVIDGKVASEPSGAGCIHTARGEGFFVGFFVVLIVVSIVVLIVVLIVGAGMMSRAGWSAALYGFLRLLTRVDNSPWVVFG